MCLSIFVQVLVCSYSIFSRDSVFKTKMMLHSAAVCAPVNHCTGVHIRALLNTVLLVSGRDYDQTQSIMLLYLSCTGKLHERHQKREMHMQKGQGTIGEHLGLKQSDRFSPFISI